MDDRRPIRGIVLKKSEAGNSLDDLIVQATAAEVAALTLGDKVSVLKRTDLNNSATWDVAKALMPGEYLYDAQGNRVACVIDVSFHSNVDMVDSTSFCSTGPMHVYTSGHHSRPSICITAQGL